MIKRHGGGSPPNTAATFWRNVQKGDGCWLWTGRKDKDGYGQIRVKGPQLRAHRFSYELENGPIPSGKCVRHTCDTPACVNPAHLVVGTHQENMADRNSRGRQASGTRNGRAKLNDGIIAELRGRFTGKRGQVAALAREYGINKYVAHDILTGKTWKHVPSPIRTTTDSLNLNQ